MKAYSKDLRVPRHRRHRPGRAARRGRRQFQVSLRSIKRWLRRRRETGTLAPSPRPGPPAHKTAALRAGLLPQLEAQPDATLEDHCRWWEEAHAVRVSTATMSRVITGHFGWTRKQRP